MSSQRLALAIVVVVLAGCSPRADCSVNCPSPVEPTVSVRQADGAPPSEGDVYVVTLRSAITNLPDDTRTTAATCVVGSDPVAVVCAKCDAIRAKCPFELVVPGNGFSLSIGLSVGGAPLVSASFTPHAHVLSSECCGDVATSWDPMTLTIP